MNRRSGDSVPPGRPRTPMHLDRAHQTPPGGSCEFIVLYQFQIRLHVQFAHPDSAASQRRAAHRVRNQVWITRFGHASAQTDQLPAKLRKFERNPSCRFTGPRYSTPTNLAPRFGIAGQSQRIHDFPEYVAVEIGKLDGASADFPTSAGHVL